MSTTGDIQYLRSLADWTAQSGVRCVSVPKLARDWLCDQADRVGVLEDALRDAIGEYESLWESEFRTATNEPPAQFAHWRFVLDSGHPSFGQSGDATS